MAAAVARRAPRGVEIALGLVHRLPRTDGLVPEGAGALELRLGQTDVGVGLDHPGAGLGKGCPVVVRAQLRQELSLADPVLLLHLQYYDRSGQIGSDDHLGPRVGHDPAFGGDVVGGQGPGGGGGSLVRGTADRRAGGARLDAHDDEQPEADQGPQGAVPETLGHDGSPLDIGYLGGDAFDGEKAVADLQDAVGDRADLRVVRDDEERAVLLLGQRAEHLEDLAADLRVEVRGRLVGEQDRRLARQGPGDRDALLLAAGEIARQEALAVGQAHGVEHALGLGPRGGALEALDVQRVLDVLERRERGEEVELLEDEADRLLADRRQPCRPGGVDLLAVDDDPPGARREDAAEDREQRRLARARTAPRARRSRPGRATETHP